MAQTKQVIVHGGPMGGKRVSWDIENMAVTAYSDGMLYRLSKDKTYLVFCGKS